MISLIIPTNKTNSEYTNNILNNIKEIYPDVEVIIEENNSVTLGINYNNAVAKAKGEKIILLHNDMIIKPGFIETMDKHIQKGRITTYTRIEPPIYPDTYPGKVILDCGFDLNTFNKEKFLNYNTEEKLTDGGSQLFFGCMKEDYLGIDGHTFKMFCEDDDLHLRYKIAGFEHKVSSAHVYHFVSKTSRVGDYQSIEQESNINFVKKWGFRKSEYNVIYNKKYILTNGNDSLTNALEMWFNGGDDIVVEINGGAFTQNDYTYIQQLNDIVKENNELGVFELGNLKITVNSLEEQQQKYIRL
jgi:GT2 family glycosyltransferase